MSVLISFCIEDDNVDVTDIVLVEFEELLHCYGINNVEIVHEFHPTIVKLTDDDATKLRAHKDWFDILAINTLKKEPTITTFKVLAQ